MLEFLGTGISSQIWTLMMWHNLSKEPSSMKGSVSILSPSIILVCSSALPRFVLQPTMISCATKKSSCNNYESVHETHSNMSHSSKVVSRGRSPQLCQHVRNSRKSPEVASFFPRTLHHGGQFQVPKTFHTTSFWDCHSRSTLHANYTAYGDFQRRSFLALQKCN